MQAAGGAGASQKQGAESHPRPLAAIAKGKCTISGVSATKGVHLPNVQLDLISEKQSAGSNYT